VAVSLLGPVRFQTGGGPDNATHTTGLEVWSNAFIYLQVG
jgi:hypothetical protein